MTMWRDLTMQQKSDLMQMTGIFDPVRLRLEYDAYLIGILDLDYQEEPNKYNKGGSIHIKHPGRLTALKKRTGKTEAELWRTGSKAVRKMITFARNSRKWKHDDGGYLDDIIWDNNGLWNHPGQITGITGTKNGTDITMDGVADYLIGKDNLGNVKFMKPGMDYHFPGSSVVEYPLKYQFGGLFKKKPETNYLYATYGIDTPYNNVSVSPVKTDYFGLFNSTQDQTFNPVQDNVIGRDYNMPDYNALAIVQTPMYMNEQPMQLVVNALNPVTLRNRQMYAESTGNPRAKSHAGALGLFQIMPDTLKWYQGKTNDYGDVNDPVYNERVRDWLMNWIFDRPILKRDDIDDMEKQRLAYAAYNGGYGTVSKAYNKYGSDWINHVPKESRDYALFIVDGMDIGGGRTNKAYDDWYNKGNEYIKQYGGLIRPFSYTDIPVVRYGNDGSLFLTGSFMTPQDDLKKTFGSIRAPQSWYDENKKFLVPELESKKPQPLQPLEGTYGSKYSELVPMSDGIYVNNPINKGLQQDWRTFDAEIALPFIAAAGPAIGSTATWLASKPALYNLARMTLSSEIGGRSVDLASKAVTGNTWGLNIGNAVESITGRNPNNSLIGLFVTEGSNPGYFGIAGLNRIGRRRIKTNDILDIFGSAYLRPDEFPGVNIIKSQKPMLDAENYLNRHKQRIIDRFGADAYNNIKLFTYGPKDEAKIKRVIRLAIWDEYHDPILALNKNEINKNYSRMAAQPGFNIGKRAVVINPGLYKKEFPDVFRMHGDKTALDMARSHEIDHIFSWYKPMLQKDLATSGLFDLDRIDSGIRDYLSHRNNTELSARGSLLKDYFGTNTITGDQLRYAARNYIRDTGLDNNMTDFFNGIKDWDGMAKWISKNSTAIASPFLIGSFLNNKESDNGNNQQIH